MQFTAVFSVCSQNNGGGTETKKRKHFVNCYIIIIFVTITQRYDDKREREILKMLSREDCLKNLFFVLIFEIVTCLLLSPLRNATFLFKRS